MREKNAFLREHHGHATGFNALDHWADIANVQK
jgi:hypothetical protein